MQSTHGGVQDATRRAVHHTEADHEEPRVTSDIGPWAMVPSWVMQHLKGAEIAVYASLGSFSDRDGNSYPYTKTIAERAGVSVSTVRNTIQKMRRLGILATTERRRSDGSLSGLDYHLIYSRPAHLNTTPVTPASDPKPPAQTHVSAGHSQSLHPVTPLTHTSDARTHQENTPSKYLKEEIPALAEASPITHTPTQLFDEFWNHYPRKVGKLAALKAWKNATKKTNPTLIVEGVRRYADDPNRDPNFTKHPATWLNAGCWDDEPETPRPTTSKMVERDGQVMSQTTAEGYDLIARLAAKHHHHSNGQTPAIEGAVWS